MRVIVCGSRNWTSRRWIQSILLSLPGDTTIIEGECRGADLIAREIAEELNMTIEPHPAEWDKLGKRAGPLRNQAMLDSGADLVLAFHKDLSQSKGTKHMIEIARKNDIPVMIFPRA